MRRAVFFLIIKQNHIYISIFPTHIFGRSSNVSTFVVRHPLHQMFLQALLGISAPLGTSCFLSLLINQCSLIPRPSHPSVLQNVGEGLVKLIMCNDVPGRWVNVWRSGTFLLYSCKVASSEPKKRPKTT